MKWSDTKMMIDYIKTYTDKTEEELYFLTPTTLVDMYNEVLNCNEDNC